MYWFLWPLRLVWLLVCCLYKEVYLQIFKCVSFWLHGCCGDWEGWLVNQVNHTSWVAVVTPTNCPKSVRICCLIELFCSVVCVVTLPFWHFCWCRGFFHRTGSDLLLFVFISTLIPGCSVERCNKVPRVRVFKVPLFISFEFWLSCVIDSFILLNLFPTITWTSLWLPFVSLLHLPDVSCRKLFTTTKVALSPLHFGSPNSKSQSVSNSGRTAKSFRLTNRVNRRFSKISTCNVRRCLTCPHISCKSTVTSSIYGKRYGIKIDKDVDRNTSNLIYVITWEARSCCAQYVGDRETSQSLKGRFRSHSFKIRSNSRRKHKNFLYDHFIRYNHSIENVTITPVEILSKKKPWWFKKWHKKRRLSARLNWIKRLQI